MRIYNVPETRRYWLVRAESGKYYQHFVNDGVIALGHLNDFDFEDTKGAPFLPDVKSLRESFVRQYSSDEKKRKTLLHFGQAKSFLYEMTVGDWVVTVGNFSLRVGRIIGKPFISKVPVDVVIDPKTDRRVSMNFDLRRRVEWGPSISRARLPYGLTQSLRANQTLACLDSKWEAIYHTLYPAFIKDNILHLSAKITTEDRIRNHSLSLIFKMLDEIEVIGKEFAKEGGINNFDELFSRYVAEDKLSITTKAEFHSPGDIWNSITALAGNISLESWSAYTLTAYSMLFGNQKLGFDGIIDLETRKKLWDLVIERLKKNGAEKAVESLKLELPCVDTTKLEDQSKDQN